MSVQTGGPALFLRDALLDADVPFRLVTNKPVDVEILVTDAGEFGRISQKPVKYTIDTKLSSWTVVSTLPYKIMMNYGRTTTTTVRRLLARVPPLRSLERIHSASKQLRMSGFGGG